jgi:ethanolamine ammonia-lyase large subunit
VGDVLWVYYQYCLAKGDKRSRKEIDAEGNQKIREIHARGVQLVMGHGDRFWDLKPKLKKAVEDLYTDAKICIRSEFTPEFVASIPHAIQVNTLSRDRSDYIAHAVAGERLNLESIAQWKCFAKVGACRYRMFKSSSQMDWIPMRS